MPHSRCWTGRAAALGLLLAILTGGPPTASAAQGNQGLQDGWAVGDQGQISGGQLLADELGAIQQAGAGWVRVNFRLGQCFRDWTSIGCNGQTAVQTYDPVIANVQARGLKVLGLLSSEAWPGQQSDWTANNAENTVGGTGSNTYISNFAQSAAHVLVLHYNGTNGPLIAQWEVWNEPNAWSTSPSPGVYTGSSFIYPSNFAQLLAQANTAIKSANSSASVISGGLLGLDVNGSHKGARNGYKPRSTTGSACPSTIPGGGDYLCATYTMGWQVAGWTKGAGPFDAVGQHLYVTQGSAVNSNTIQRYLGDLRTVYVNYGGDPPARQSHVTEFGWSTASVGTSQQAHNLQVAYQTFKSTSYVARGYWYRTQDLGVDNDFYGLLTTNGAAKPAFTAYQQYAT